MEEQNTNGTLAIKFKLKITDTDTHNKHIMEYATIYGPIDSIFHFIIQLCIKAASHMHQIYSKLIETAIDSILFYCQLLCPCPSPFYLFIFARSKQIKKLSFWFQIKMNPFCGQSGRSLQIDLWRRTEREQNAICTQLQMAQINHIRPISKRRCPRNMHSSTDER